jgi:hypothetical protein
VSLVVCWLFFPIVLGALALGCGLLLEQASGERFHGALLIPAGLALTVLVPQLAIGFGAEKLARPLVLVAAVAGLVLSRASLRERAANLDRWALGAAVLVYFVFGAPILLSGHATFAGFISLDDTATFSALVDRFYAHGRDLKGLPQSTYEATVQINLSAGYPVGSMLPIETVRPLVGQDLLWIYQPYLSFLAAMVSLCVYSIVTPLIVTPKRRFVVAALAAQPGILYAYAMQGGVKELAAAWLLALTGAVVAPLLRGRGSVRSAVVPAVVLGAFLATLGAGGGAWVAPTFAGVALIALITRRGSENRRLQLKQGGVFVVVAGLLTAAILHDANFLKGNALSVLSANDDRGNLITPLSKFQAFGVWPGADYRLPLGQLHSLAYALIAVMVGLAIAGAVYAIQRRRFDVLIFPLGAVASWLLISLKAGIWVDGKAIATVAPALVFASLLGAAWISRAGLGILAAGTVAAMAIGIGWTNVDTYAHVSLAPRGPLHEAEQIAKQIKGQGPTLDNEYNPYVARHLLRAAAPEGPSELRRRQVLLNNGQFLLKGAVADLDLFSLQALFVYRTIVNPKNPGQSRPPSNYKLVRDGTYYTVWQRKAGPPNSEILDRIGGGDYDHVSSVLPCKSITALAAKAAGDKALRLRAAFKPENITVEPTTLNKPSHWIADADGRRVLARDQGVGTGVFTVPHAGRYHAYLGGSFARGFDVQVDGKSIGAARWQMANLAQFKPLATIQLSAGRHTLKLVRGGASLHPGSGLRPLPVFLEGLGPFSLEQAGAKWTVSDIKSADARRRICGKPVDWIELVKPGASIPAPAPGQSVPVSQVQ